jgi:hypothetical protein
VLFTWKLFTLCGLSFQDGRPSFFSLMMAHYKPFAETRESLQRNARDIFFALRMKSCSDHVMGVPLQGCPKSECRLTCVQTQWVPWTNCALCPLLAVSCGDTGLGLFTLTVSSPRMDYTYGYSYLLLLFIICIIRYYYYCCYYNYLDVELLLLTPMCVCTRIEFFLTTYWHKHWKCTYFTFLTY